MEVLFAQELDFKEVQKETLEKQNSNNIAISKINWTLKQLHGQNFVIRNMITWLFCTDMKIKTKTDFKSKNSFGPPY